MLRELLDRLSNTAVEVEELPIEQLAIVGSERSQRSLLLEASLRRALEKVSAAKRQAEKRICEFEEEKLRRAKQLIEGPLISSQAGFDDACAQIESSRALVTSCEAPGAEIQERIDELIPGPEQSRARLEQQRQFARLAADRLSMDRQAFTLTKELRAILNQRSEVTDEMQKIAHSLDLTVGREALDGTRFDRLHASLSDEDYSASEEWFNCFCGGEKKTTGYVVADEELTIPETLADAGVHHFGDRIHLPHEQAAELLRADRQIAEPKIRDLAASTSDAPRWQHSQASIMTVEAYDAAVKKAGESGLDPRLYLSMCHSDNLRRDKMVHDATTSQAHAQGGYNV